MPHGSVCKEDVSLPGGAGQELGCEPGGLGLNPDAPLLSVLGQVPLGSSSSSENSYYKLLLTVSRRTEYFNRENCF